MTFVPVAFLLLVQRGQPRARAAHATHVLACGLCTVPLSRMSLGSESLADTGVAEGVSRGGTSAQGRTRLSNPRVAFSLLSIAHRQLSSKADAVWRTSIFAGGPWSPKTTHRCCFSTVYHLPPGVVLSKPLTFSPGVAALLRRLHAPRKCYCSPTSTLHVWLKLRFLLSCSAVMKPLCVRYFIFRSSC